MTKQAEQEALWQLKDRSFSQVKRDLGVSYTSLRRLLEIEQDIHQKKKVRIPKKIFLMGGEKLSEEVRGKLNAILERYPGLKGFYWAKEKIRELYRQETREKAARVLDNLILNLKCADDGEMLSWGNTLKHWREPILNYFY